MRSPHALNPVKNFQKRSRTVSNYQNLGKNGHKLSKTVEIQEKTVKNGQTADFWTVNKAVKGSQKGANGRPKCIQKSIFGEGREK